LLRFPSSRCLPTSCALCLFGAKLALSLLPKS
jgi:hypothetical protein